MPGGGNAKAGIAKSATADTCRTHHRLTGTIKHPMGVPYVVVENPGKVPFCCSGKSEGRTLINIYDN